VQVVQLSGCLVGQGMMMTGASKLSAGDADILRFKQGANAADRDESQTRPVSADWMCSIAFTAMHSAPYLTVFCW